MKFGDETTKLLTLRQVPPLNPLHHRLWEQGLLLVQRGHDLDPDPRGAGVAGDIGE